MGSGGDYMLGGIHCLSQVLDDPREIIHRAYEVPIKFGYGCGGEVEIINVTQTVAEAALNEEQEKTIQKKKKPDKKKKEIKAQKALSSTENLKMAASL
jgi:hypothetical protein